MRVILDGQPVTLKDADLLGEGGEARVYALSADEVLKVFHLGAPAAVKKLREQKLRAFPFGLPSSVVAPLGLALDDQGAIAGYRMKRVSGAVDLAALSKPALRASQSRNATLSLFKSLLATINALHARGVVVGDCNGGNVVVEAAGAGAAFFIDADSMQLPGLPCAVAHERFLDPRLYGVDLVKACAFLPEHDHYALRVLLFQTLLGVHPYGGTHNKLGTLLRRAEARHSCLRDDVTLPKIAASPKTLPDALAHDFSCVFDDDKRHALSAALLDATYVRCACGVEHAKKQCPACQVKVAVPAMLVKGAVAFELIKRGVVVAAAQAGGGVAFVVVEGGKLVREDGGVVAGEDAVSCSFGFEGRRTWIGLGSELVCVEHGAVVERTSTSLVFGAPAFAASPAGLFRLHGDAIVHHGSGFVVGRALIGRTFLFPVDDGCLALWRAGQVAHALWCRPGHAPVDVALPALDGRIVDVAVTSNGDRALIGVAVDVNGKRVHRVTLLNKSKGVLAHKEGRPEDLPVLASIRGKLISGAQVVTTSSKGLVLLDEQLEERAHFQDTEGVVDEGVDLFRGSGGDVYVVDAGSVHLLRRRGNSSTTTKP